MVASSAGRASTIWVSSASKLEWSLPGARVYKNLHSVREDMDGKQILDLLRSHCARAATWCLSREPAMPDWHARSRPGRLKVRING